MNEICPIEKCSGCAACYNGCAKGAISFYEGELGHLYPRIDESKCVDCGVCRSVCPVNRKIEGICPQKAYAGWRKSKEDRKQSSSGGAASSFSSYVLANNGVVYGAAVVDGCVRHIRIDAESQLPLLKGSKYVQSRIDDAYSKVKADLLARRNVLFIGTPCQIAGLKCFLKKDDPLLTTVDLICHGVPSLRFLQNYIKEQTGREKFDNVVFRSPKGFILKVYNDAKLIYSKKLVSLTPDLFFAGFMRSLFYRRSCYRCPYAQNNRVADITIGDFWGLGAKTDFPYSRKDGVSLILTSTEKGENLLHSCADDLFFLERDVSEAFAGNKQLNRPSADQRYRQFLNLYQDQPIGDTIKSILKKEIVFYKKRAIYTAVARWIPFKKSLKRFFLSSRKKG